MKWFRLYAEFAFDPKIQSLSETFQRRYIMLLCVTCNGGIEKITDDELACAMRISLDELEETKNIFIKKELIGNSWMPRTWAERQYLSDVSTARVRKFRNKNKDVSETFPKRNRNRNVTSPDTDTDTDTDKDIYIPYAEIMDCLNQTCGTKYKLVDAHKKLIRARFNDKYTLADFKTVISKKAKEWLKTEQATYLRPSTLFGNKFDTYLNQPDKCTNKPMPRAFQSLMGDDCIDITGS